MAAWLSLHDYGNSEGRKMAETVISAL